MMDGQGKLKGRAACSSLRISCKENYLRKGRINKPAARENTQTNPILLFRLL